MDCSRAQRRFRYKGGMTGIEALKARTPEVLTSAALVAGLWLVQGLFGLVQGQRDDFAAADYLLELLWAVALLVSTLALLHLLPAQPGLAFWGGLAAVAGQAALLVSSLGSLASGDADGPLGFLFPLGVLALLVGLVIWVIAGLAEEQALPLPPLVLLAAWALALAFGGGLALAAAWLAIHRFDAYIPIGEQADDELDELLPPRF